MKMIKANRDRDLIAQTIFKCGEFAYELDKDFLTLPDFLRYTPICTGCCDENDNIYVVKQNGSLKITSVKLHKNLKVKSYTFEENFNENYACPKNSLSITYEDNSVEKMENDVHVSTLYERYNK